MINSLKTTAIKLLAVIFLFTLSANSSFAQNSQIANDSLKTDSAKKYLEKADKFMEKGKFKKAYVQYKLANKYLPEDDKIYEKRFKISMMLESKERFNESMAEWIKATPESKNAWIHKAFGAATFSMYHDALAAFDTLVKLEPSEAGYHYGRGQMLYQIEEYQKALEAFENSYEMDTTLNDAIGARAVCLVRLNRIDDAFKCQNKYVQLEPNNGTAYYNRACIYCLSGDNKNALKDLEVAFQYDESLKTFALSDEDLEPLWDNAEFKKLIE